MKFTTDFTRIGYDTQLEIEKEINESLNATAVLICKLSNHPDDDYLYLYIAQKGNGTYITGLANTSRGGRVGLYENHYDCTFKYAMQVMADKIIDCNKNA